MTKQEFINRTGIDPTDEQFVKIHSIYMECPTIDKDEFCRDWAKHKDSSIIDSLHVVAVNRDLFIDLLKRERSKMVDIMLKEACATYSAALKNACIEMVGHAEVISRMFDLELGLWPGDKDYIMKNLK
jgi:hypothetical protein